MPKSPLKILLVEDNPTDADLLVENLSDAGAEITIAWVERFKPAVARLEREPFDAVLLDLILPDSSGLANLVRLNKTFPDIPIIVLTGIDDEVSQMEAIRSHAQDYLVKGEVSGKMLANSIRHAVERKKTERMLQQTTRELDQLNKTLLALGKSGRAITHNRDEAEYLKEVCKIVVEDCGHSMVWIGIAEDDEEKSVRPVASAGFEEGYLETLTISWADSERGRGPTGTAIRTGKITKCGNMLTDPAFAPWRDEARKRGYASSIVLPLMENGRSFGALSIYSKETDPFSEAEIKVLSELADDLALGITRFRLQREEAENHRRIQDLNRFLEQRTLDLTVANKELEAFSYSVAHDLRNPLNAIISCAQVVSIDTESTLGATGREALARITGSAERMGQVITDLLMLSNISRQKISNEKTILSELAQASFHEVKSADPLRDAHFEIQPGLAAQGDPGLLRILMENLIRNAWKFTSRRKNTRIEFGEIVKEGQDCYYLRDNGVGFDMTESARLFRPFQRLHSQEEYKGSGIGLAMVKRIIDRHGGKIWAEGEKDKGATIFFCLPKS